MDLGVRRTREGRAAILSFDWPERRNALGPDECLEASAALEDIAADPEVHGVVITGEGSFCAGGDLKGAVARVGLSERERRDIVYSVYQNLIRSLVAVPVTTVAAVDGPAIGLGFDIALACDSRFVGPAVWFLQGWGRVGFAPGAGGEWLLRLRAPDLLWRLLETQPKIGPELAETLRLGESSGVVSARERAVARIDALAAISREAIEAYVGLSRSDLRAGLEDHLAAAVDAQMKLLGSSAVKALVAAVLDKSRAR